MNNHKCIIAREGLPFIIFPGTLGLIFLAVDYTKTAYVLFIVTAFVIWFFRNPNRNTPINHGLVISPADGKIINIERINLSDIVKGQFIKISIFMNVFNVHVNRIPYSGTVKTIRYKKGKFISANLDKASSLNEQNAVLITTEQGAEILTVQIAGLIARRIVCWIVEGMRVSKGEPFGLIRFGSRLDVYLPINVAVSVKTGDIARAGETVLGVLP